MKKETTSKIPIYLVPGLAASPIIFQKLSLDPDLYELHFLKWKKPLALEETLKNYAKRMCQDIKHKKPILIGVSFGGIMVQEMSKFIETRKVIIISSVKSTKELPKRLKIVRLTKVYKLFPTKIITNIEYYLQHLLIGKFKERKITYYQKYLSVRSKKYLKWAIYHVINWQQKKPLHNIVHIHGNNDRIFPIKHIKNAIEIEKGSHIMILTKAKKISEHIHEAISC